MSDEQRMSVVILTGCGEVGDPADPSLPTRPVTWKLFTVCECGESYVGPTQDDDE